MEKKLVLSIIHFVLLTAVLSAINYYSKDNKDLLLSVVFGSLGSIFAFIFPYVFKKLKKKAL